MTAAMSLVRTALRTHPAGDVAPGALTTGFAERPGTAGEGVVCSEQ
jgi:hypothetical protein